MTTIKCGDCLGFLKAMSDKSVDLCLTDPPYGIGADKGAAGYGIVKGRKYKGNWDKNIPSKEYFEEILRVAKVVMIFGGNYFAHLLPPSKCWLVWDKKGDIKFKNPFADCELIYTNLKTVVKKYKFLQQGFIKESNDKRVHPTQKPTELLMKILQDYTPEKITVLDPFMGSGSVGVACVNTNRNFIGVEINENYFNIAKPRIEIAKLKNCSLDS